MVIADDLARVVAALPNGGEARLGQRQMSEAVARAIATKRHLVVQAGTGTGKSLAYLVPVISSGTRVVIATATKALQDQLATKDLPFLADHLDHPFDFAVLKGRSNYLCRQRVDEVTGTAQLEMDDVAPAIRIEIRRLAAWADTAETGDQADLDWAPSPRAWQAVSVTSDECPGATRCPAGVRCFAELARNRAAAADVIVVNLHLYGTHLASGGVVLPEHDVVVMDEAHQVEDVISDTSGLSIAATRLVALARTLKQVSADDVLIGNVASAGNVLTEALVGHVNKRLPRPLPPQITAALVTIRNRADDVSRALREIQTEVAEANQRKLRAQKAVLMLTNDIDMALEPPKSTVTWVEGPTHNPHLAVAPIDVGPVLKAGVWDRRTAILTSATIPGGIAEQLDLPAGTVDVLDVGSPFDYASHALLYCATHLPDPRSAKFSDAMHDELEALIKAAGGRTLALFTSWRAMDLAVEALRDRVPYRLLNQKELPKPALIRAFADDESSCLFATVGLFQGIDVPGRTLSLVTIDKIPFPRPDEPLLDARREQAGAAAFRTVDLPRATTLLAQAAGRLIRTADDRGVVAIFDPRLNRASYRWDVVKALPPMARTRHRADAEAFLSALD